MDKPASIARSGVRHVQDLASQLAPLTQISSWLRLEACRDTQLKHPGTWHPGTTTWKAVTKRLNSDRGSRALHDLYVAAGLPIFDFVRVAWDHRANRRKYQRTQLAVRYDEDPVLPRCRSDVDESPIREAAYS